MIRVVCHLPSYLCNGDHLAHRESLADTVVDAGCAHFSVEGSEVEPADVDVLLMHYAPESATNTYILVTIEAPVAWSPDGQPRDLRTTDLDDRLEAFEAQILKACSWIETEARPKRERPIDSTYRSIRLRH